MERFTALGRGMQIMLVAGVLLLIDTFFNWQGDGFGLSAWDDVGGIVMGLLTAVLVAWIIARLAGVQIPLPVSAAMTSAVFAALILLFALIKNLQDDFSTFWAWLGMAFAVAIAVGAWLEVQAAGGMQTLRSEMPSMGSSAPATPAAPPPPAAPEAPPAAAEAYMPPPPPATEPAEPEAAPDEPEPASDEPGERADREM